MKVWKAGTATEPNPAMVAMNSRTPVVPPHGSCSSNPVLLTTCLLVVCPGMPFDFAGKPFIASSFFHLQTSHHKQNPRWGCLADHTPVESPSVYPSTDLSFAQSIYLPIFVKVSGNWVTRLGSPITTNLEISKLLARQQLVAQGKPLGTALHTT